MQLEHARCQKNALAIALAAVEIDNDPHVISFIAPIRSVNEGPLRAARPLPQIPSE
jgi:hypothetical protein